MTFKQYFLNEIASNFLSPEDEDAAKWIANYLFMATQSSKAYTSSHNQEDLKDFQMYNKYGLELFNAQVKKGANSVALSAAIKNQYKIYMDEV